MREKKEETIMSALFCCLIILVLSLPVLIIGCGTFLKGTKACQPVGFHQQERIIQIYVNTNDFATVVEELTNIK